MIIEGGSTVLLASFAFWWMPESTSKCSWLTEEEKIVAEYRMLQDGSTRTQEKLDIRSAMKAIFDWKVIVFSVMGFCYGTGSAIVTNFTPQLVARLGYSSVKTNLYTVARK